MTHIWCISLVLVTLGQRLGRRARPFTVAELFEWAPGLKQVGTAHRACNMLAHAGLLQAAPPPAHDPGANQNPSRPAAWQLTTAGTEATRTARLEAASRKRSQTATAVNQARSFPDSLALRLWLLLRTRRAITSLEALDVLCDAGEDTRRLRKQISKYLAAWHALLPQTVQVSARRIGKCYRYVLVGDVGRFPPELRNSDHRRRALRKSAKAMEARP